MSTDEFTILHTELKNGSALTLIDATASKHELEPGSVVFLRLSRSQSDEAKKWAEEHPNSVSISEDEDNEGRDRATVCLSDEAVTALHALLGTWIADHSMALAT